MPVERGQTEPPQFFMPEKGTDFPGTGNHEEPSQQMHSAQSSQEGDGIEDLAQKFTYKSLKDIPPGVTPKQFDFLHEAATIGAFSWLREQTAGIITEYFTTQATYGDIAKDHNISVPAVRERITRGLAQMRRVLYSEKPELAEEDRYPLGEIGKGKDRLEMVRSDKSRMRNSYAQANRLRTQSAPIIDIFAAKTDDNN